MFANVLKIKNRNTLFTYIFRPFAVRLSYLAQVHPVSIHYSWFVSTTWLDSPVVNLIDWTWFGKANTCLYKGPTVDSACQRKNQAMRSKELSIELWDRIVLRYRSGEGYKYISAALKVPKNTVASIIPKWKELGNTKALAVAGRQGRDGQVLQQKYSDRTPEFLCGDRRTFQMDNHLCSTHQSGHYGGVARRKPLLSKRHMNVLEWPSQSPDISLIKHLWRDQKIAERAKRSLSNLTELERTCRE